MDTADIISKEALSSPEPWQFDSFDGHQRTNGAIPNKRSNPAVSNEVNKPGNSKSPTKAQADALYRQAKEEGYAAGFQSGREAGHQEGKQYANVELKAETERIYQLLSELNQALLHMDEQIAQDLLSLALDLSKEMLTQALEIKPELILPIVQEAIRQLPNALEHPHLYLHPDDAVLVREKLAEQLSHADWEIHEDDKIEKGGCRIDTNGSELDASMSTRWQRVLATIGQKDDWLT
jgi:flagellar assembly protein FliH